MEGGSGGPPPEKILISMKQNRVILDSLGLNIHYLKRILTVYFCRNTCKVNKKSECFKFWFIYKRHRERSELKESISRS